MNAAAGGKPHGGFASDGLTLNLFRGDNTGTTSATTIHMGLGNDVIALNAADGTGANPSSDTLVLNGAFGDDVVMNFTTGGHDKIDATAGKYDNDPAGHTFTAITGKGIKGNDSSYGLLDGATITLQATGKTLLVVENTATINVNDYWFFEVTSKDTTLDKDDTITLLGTITTGTDVIVAGDITV